MKNKIVSLLIVMFALLFKANVGLAYYDAELGRFIQPDSVIPDLSNPQSYNRYSYCVNNPLRYTDPSGHEPGDLFTDQPMMTSADAVIMAKAGAPIMIGTVVAVGTAGAATPLLVGAGASAGFATVGAGIVGGAAGNLAAQGTQIGLGTRSSISGQEVAVSGLTGGAINGAVAGVSKVISSVGTPKLAAPTSPASQAAVTVANDVNLTAAQQAKLTAFNKNLPKANTGTAVDKVGDQVLFTSDVPGKVPGSKAVYQKTVNPAGTTTSMVKTTFDPKGNVVHIKDKLSSTPSQKSN